MTKKASKKAAPKTSAKKAAPAKRSFAPGGVEVTQLQVLADWLTNSALEEVEIEAKGLRVRLKKPGGYSAGVSMAPMMAAAPAPTAATPSRENVFQAPMVGTFYRASGPDASPFVNVGDSVRAGQTLCIIEAMKTMNQIAADRSGTVREIMVKNAQPVEYGQPLFVIE